MTDPILIERNGHRTWLKWHRGRRRASDPVFTGARILEAMRLGASVEVDLVVTADGGMAVLHDLTLDRETTGTGPVADTRDAAIRALRLRDNYGAPTDQPVMLLEDLCALMAQGEVHPDALLQLDYKEDESVLDAQVLAAFQHTIAPVAHRIILSSGSAIAVSLLKGGVDDLQIGYDPCHDGAMEQLEQSRDFFGFVSNALDASPHAELIYLAYPLVLQADRSGFDIVTVLHELGRRVDAYTISAANSDSRETVERLLALKVDQITTDDPEGLLALVG